MTGQKFYFLYSAREKTPLCLCIVEQSLHAGPLFSSSRAVLTAWGVHRGQKGLLAHNKEIYTHTHTLRHTQTHTNRTGTKNKKNQAHKGTNRHIYTHTHSHTHVQPSGPDQYMTRVNLLRTSGSPIKGLGVLIGDHKSQGETNNDVNPQQHHNGPNSSGLWEWRRRVTQAWTVFLCTSICASFCMWCNFSLHAGRSSALHECVCVCRQ